MSHRIKKWFLRTNDKLMGNIYQWIAEKLHISLLPSQGRWGAVSLLSSVSLFFLALFTALYAMYLSNMGGKAMPFIMWIVLAIGVAVLLFAGLLSIYLLRTPRNEEFSQDVSDIKRELGGIGATLKEIKKVIGDGRRKR